MNKKLQYLLLLDYLKKKFLKILFIFDFEKVNNYIRTITSGKNAYANPSSPNDTLKRENGVYVAKPGNCEIEILVI